MVFDKIIGDVMGLFEDIDRQTEKFGRQTGLKCKNGCGACCENPRIETTVTEVLPLAAYLHSQGQAENKLEAIRLSPPESLCIFYEPDPAGKGKGRCGVYTYRPGMCRLFGFAARQDKHGKPQLMTCKVIKDSQPRACQQTQEDLQKGLEAPLLTTYALRIANIDPVHGQQLLPINQAISVAPEKVGYMAENSK